MENIRDCISRQLWWGHRISLVLPDCEEMIVSKAGNPLYPVRPAPTATDPDVLIHGSPRRSGPFNTGLAQEDTGPGLSYSVMVTGRDIIFSVARMIFSGLAFMNEVPFREVFIHGLVMDALAEK